MMNSPRRRPRRLAVSLLAIGGLAASVFAVGSPAAAQSEPGVLQFANGFDTARFTAIVDAGTSAEKDIDLKEFRTIGGVDLTPGTHTVDVYEGQDPVGTPVATRSIEIESAASKELAVHPSATGTVKTTIFTNNDAKTGASTSRLVVRHIGEAGEVDVELRPSSLSDDPSMGTTDSATIANGQQVQFGDVATGGNLIYELAITPAGGSSPLIVDTEVVLDPGVELTILIAGSPPQAEQSADPVSLLERERDVGALPPPKVNLVNGFSMGQYVFYVDGVQNASIEALRQNGQLQKISEGTTLVEAYLNSNGPGSGTPAASLEIGVCDGQSYDLAIHPDTAGSPMLTLFENDVTPVASEPNAETRFTIRHIAQYGSLDVEFGSNGENSGPATTASFTLSNGDEKVIDGAIVNDYEASAFNPGTTSGAVARQPDFEGEGGTTQIGYIMGSPPGSDPSAPLKNYFPYAGEATIPTAQAPGSACPSGTSGGGSGGGSGGSGGSGGGGGSAVIGNSFTQLAPDRILDTRRADLGHSGKLAAGQSIAVDAAGVSGVPDSGVTAVVVNLTAADSDGPGYLAAVPTPPSGEPSTSSVNFVAANQFRATMVTVPLATDGTFQVYASTGVHAIADVLGYYTEETDAVAAGRFVPLAPERFFDTRTAEGPSGKIEAGTSIDVPVLGQLGVPDSGVDALVFNLTVTEPDGNGFLAATAGGVEPNNTSSVNYLATDAAVPNQVVVPIGASGDVRIFSLARAHALGDLIGYFTDDTADATESGLFVPVDPDRVFDTRTGEGGVPQGPIQSNDELVVSTLDALGGITADDVAAVSLNAAGVLPASPTFVSISPNGSSDISTLNVLPGDVRANSVYAGVDANGAVHVTVLDPIDVLADANGYFTR